MGMLFGSFANVLIYRLPKKMPFVKERSICTSCGHVLGFVDLLPFLSYFYLLGKCRFCKARFSISYPLVEIFVGFLSFGSYVIFGLFSAVLVALLLFILVVVAVIDFHTQDIYDSLAAFLFAVGLIWVLLHHFFHLPQL